MTTKKLLIAASALLLAPMAQSAGNHMDILGFYTPYARDYRGGDDQIKAAMRASLVAANQMYEDSGIDFSFSFARQMQLDIEQSELENGNWPLWRSMIEDYNEEGWQALEEIGADYYLIWSTYQGGLGAAANDGRGAIVEHWIGTYGAEVVAHEIGHSLWFSHGEGYNFTGGSGSQYRTIMKKNQGPGTDIPRFSDPGSNFDSVPLGTTDNNNFGRIAEFERIQVLCNFREINPGGNPNLRWSVKNRITNRAITVTGQSITPGTSIQEWEDLGQNNQLWTFDAPASNGTTVARSGLWRYRYLGMMSGAAGHNATLEDWEGMKTRWNLQSLNNGYVQLKNASSGKVLYPNGAYSGSGNGQQVRQWWDWDQASTQWYFQTAD